MQDDRARILIVEDEGIVALDLQGQLEKLGHHVCRILKSGEEVLESIESLAPDLVLMDINLSGELDGIQTAERMRAVCQSPIIYMTAYADSPTLQRAKLTSPAAYIVKPFDLNNLRTAIEIALHKHQLEEALRLSEAKYRKLFSTVDHGIGLFELVTDSDGANQDFHLVDSNPAYRELLIQSEECEIGCPLGALYGENATSMRNHLENVLASGQPESFNLRMESGRLFNVKAFRSEVNRVAAMFVDITQQAQMEQRERDYTLERERVRILKDFITAVSHDLRTPLTIITTDVYLAMQRTNRDSTNQDTFERIKHQVGRLDKLVNNMLIMAELDSGLLVETYMMLNLNSIVRKVFYEYAPQAETKQLDFQLLLGDAARAMVNSNTIWRVFDNLIQNAIQYTSEGGQVIVRTTIKENRFLFSVEDTGIGIAPEDLPHIFDRFYRVDKARRMSTGGAGLGLAIAKRIVEFHGGIMQVESTPNQGSIFSVSLPMIAHFG